MFCIPIETSLSLEGALHGRGGLINQTLKWVLWIYLQRRREIGAGEDCEIVESLSGRLHWPGFLSGFPQVRRRHAALPGLTDSPPPGPQPSDFFKRFVNSSQKHTLCGFISSKHLTPELFALVQKTIPRHLPPRHWGRSTQAIGIPADVSLNRRQSSEASLRFVFTCHKRLSLSLFSSPVVQQAPARSVNAGNNNQKKSLPRDYGKKTPSKVRVILSK